jgi:agmatinase
LLGVPYDGASSYQRGAALGPAAIRAGLRNPSSNSWTEDAIDVAALGIVEDRGDLDFGDIEDGGRVRSEIETGVRALLDAGGRPVILGGDHSISYPVLRALGPRHPGLSVLHFDAHSDLYDEFEGDRYSHACPFARVMEEGLVARLVQIGIRTLTRSQIEQIARFGVEVHPMRGWSGPIHPSFEGPVYVSLDLDALDPAYIAGIAHPEPGGLSVRDIIAMIQRLSGVLVGADVVELNPLNDPSPRSGLVAAKLVKELVARMRK